jgi:hypothetical protein
MALQKLILCLFEPSKVSKRNLKTFLGMTIEFHKDKDYTDYDMKTKMLSFYFTFFQLLSANRSYVSMILKGAR